jgi:thiopeptide-type bacteriocin biosynthesis protein
MSSSPSKRAAAACATHSLYQPLDFFVLRAPLLPLEAYRKLGAATDVGGPDPLGALGADETVRCALAVASATFIEAFDRATGAPSRSAKVDSRLLRYLIRMSTRPTPFGLFAGVALGHWGAGTDLQLAPAPLQPRTRPDMAWLMRLVLKLESDPDVRRHLRLVANPAALIRAGRVFLAERVTRGEGLPPAVSLRATGVVRRALAAARFLIPYQDLATSLLANTPGATQEKVDKLLTELWEQTLLLTELRPPLTIASPARYVVERLAGIKAAADIRHRIAAALDQAAAWDESPAPRGAQRYRAMVAAAGTVADVDRAPFQVDATLGLTGRTISRQVAAEIARAAELLLRLSPLPRGPTHMSAYRQQFIRRYGADREVRVLEVLDPNFGLGPPSPNSQAASGLSAAKSSQRAQVLLELALTALRERKLTVELDEKQLKQLETWDSVARAPPSLDLFVSVAADSRAALDAGDFHIVLGPNIGASSAGRTIGRFADLLGGGTEALARAARREERHAAQALWAELTYQPRSFRSANVAIRPNVRSHEIALGVATGSEPARTIPLGELVLGVRGDRFYLRWPTAGQDVVVTGGHMLNYLRAPTVCRFLADVSRDGCCQLAGFGWGPAVNFPFLPRVQVGRVVVAMAQWRLGAVVSSSAAHPEAFGRALAQWRTEWQVPRHVYLSSGDNRLLLDLATPLHVVELRRAVVRQSDSILLTEVLPGLDQAWVRDGDDRAFMTELAVPLVLRNPTADLAATAEPLRQYNHATPELPAVAGATIASPAIHLRPPGSDWLFAKIYGGRALEDDLIAGPIRTLVTQLRSAGLAEDWFFLRYSDPDRHLRLRVRGEPARLVKELFPIIATWAGELIAEGACQRFALDTYEREIERFGGCEGMTAAESLFTADSGAVADLIDLIQAKQIALDRTELAILSADALLDGMGLDSAARAAWCRRYLLTRQDTGDEYRKRKDRLRSLLGDGRRVLEEPGGTDIASILARLRRSAGTIGAQLRELEARGELTRPPGDLYDSFVHLHLNRLLGADHAMERRVLGLLWRAHQGLVRAPLPLVERIG